MPKPYKLAINMAGAVSAGAYTAGVLDFLIEALDAWERAKSAGEAVPQHSVSIEILTGASAGAMCSALGAVSLYDAPNPCPGLGQPWKKPTRMYEAWVNEIDIGDLVSTTDLASGELTSLLNCDTLDQIAVKTLGAPAPVTPRSFVSPSLNLMLTLTNLRGVPYSVDFSNKGSFEEQADYFADQIQFSLANGAPPAPTPPVDCVVDLTNADAEAWKTLRTAALASGAVPAMLRPRILTRTPGTYANRKWAVAVDPSSQPPGSPCVCEQEVAVIPAWTDPPPSFDNVYVDGGTTNNNPFECARRYLADQAGTTHNPRDPMLADRSVLTVAPFPGHDVFNPKWNVQHYATLFGAVSLLKDVLVGQSRFLGESLTLIKDGNAASRYIVVPSDPTAPVGAPALQCGSLGAFGGFFSRIFRDHDYHLGRYNCQRFLEHWFVLPCENELIAAGLPAAKRDDLIARFRPKDKPDEPPRSEPETAAWMPIIPLCGALSTPLEPPKIIRMTPDALDKVLDGAFGRLEAVLKKVLQPLKWGWLASRILPPIVTRIARDKATPWIEQNLRDSRCL